MGSDIGELEDRAYHAAERLFGGDAAQVILAVLSDHSASLAVMLHAMTAIERDEPTARDCAELVAERLAGRDVRGELAQVGGELLEARAELAAMREAAAEYFRALDDSEASDSVAACDKLRALLTPEAK